MTGEQFVNIVIKRLMGAVSFREQFLEYLRTQYTNFVAQVYNKNGTYGSSPVAFAIGSADKFSLTVDAEGTDGIGHLLKVGDTYEQNVQFENANAVDYYVGLRYTERPEGVQINPRTGYPEYESWGEVIGERGDPDEVLDQTGYLRFHFNTVAGGVNESVEGRKALVWKKVPAAGGTSEAIAIEVCDCHDYGGVATGTAYCDTAGYLGQDDPSLEASDYYIILLGPRVSRYTDLSAVSGYWFIGTVTGGGAGNPPSGSDTSGQRLITKSLSDLLENLVYDNVVNTFTRKQIFAPTVAEEAINATGKGANPAVKGTGGDGGGAGAEYTGTGSSPGVKGTGGPSGGRGLHGQGVGSGAGVYGKGGDSGGAGGIFEGGVGPGIGVWAKPGIANGTSGRAVYGDGAANGGGYGGYFTGKATSPRKAPVLIGLQDTDPSENENGGHWQLTTHRAKVLCNGDKRVYAESRQTRRLLYPLSLGMEYTYETGMHWYWDYTGHYWYSDNSVNPEYMTFDLNGFVPQGCMISNIRVRVYAGANRVLLADRTRAELWKRDLNGANPMMLARNYSGGTIGYYDVQLLPYGTHTGGSGAAVLTDATKNWVPGALVGQTVYNLTDGSTGTITANTATTITATLTGGTENDWDTGDTYQVAGGTIKMATPVEQLVQYYIIAQSGNDNQIDRIHTVEIQYLEGDYLAVP